MDRWQRRTVGYVVALSVLILGFTVVYQLGMAAFEGRSITFFHALQVVVETFAATGYGSDSPWTTPAMNLLVVIMNITGVTSIFLALPVLVFPLLEDALSTSAPTALEAPLADHVVICTYTPRVDTLIAELESIEVEYVIVEPDRERARELYERDYTVINADPNTVDALERAGLGDARALVADVSDEVDASIVLTAREVTDDVRIVSVVEEPDRARYHELAGADVVLSPRPLLGESLAHKVTTAISTDLGDAIEIGDDFDIIELPVERGSELVGQTLAEAGLRERAGVNVIGAWFEGEFVSPPSPDATIDGGTILLVTGREDQLGQLKELTLSELRRYQRGETVVVGYGEVGRTIATELEEAGIPHTVVDRRELDGVDVVGDATDPEVLERAGVPAARSVILAVPDDTTTEFATLVIRDLSDDTEVIARAEEAESVRKIYRAGADYVLALANVSGRMTASAVLEDEDILSLDTQVEVVRTAAPGLAGRTLGEADVRARTGCTVVAVDRNGEVFTNVGPEFEIEAGDELIIAGTDEGTNRFVELLG